MARKLQVLVELDFESGDVKVTAPWNHAGAVVKVLGCALQQAGDVVATQQKKATEELAKAKDGRTESGLIVPKGVVKA